MRDAFILDGDVVVIRPSARLSRRDGGGDAEEGGITLKRLARMAGRWFSSRNPDYTVITDPFTPGRECDIGAQALS
jgi:SOS-response transcriptional repressor LexA